MAFTNKSVTPLRDNKPHIVKRAGLWRVSPMPKPYRKYQHVWNLAHIHARLLNTRQQLSETYPVVSTVSELLTLEPGTYILTGAASAKVAEQMAAYFIKELGK